VHDKWAATVFAPMMLFAAMHMSIFLQLLGCTLGTRISHVHSLLLTSLASAGGSEQQYQGIAGRAPPV
jgi:hypothetical protein